MFAKRAVLFSILATGVGLAQSLSAGCQSTLASLVVSPNSACLNPQALVGIVTADDNASLVNPIDNWLSGQCSQPQCTNETLANIVSTVTAGCQSDLQSLGFGNLSADEITNVVQMAYPTVRKVACLSNQSNNTLCVTETLNNVQSSVGTLSKTELQSLVSQISGGQLPDIPSSTLCTDCTKEGFNIVKTDFPSLVTSNIEGVVTNECSADFVDGSTPSNIEQTANTATATPAGNASGSTMASLPVGIAFSAILTLTSAFALFV
ncbi:unnamed protein product [Somion occarium]|uniref:Uncharacterized protein n=1 Tax=Somion occarium TaxID=3059160 RepID=A0ABP1DJF8_9APHY